MSIKPKLGRMIFYNLVGVSLTLPVMWGIFYLLFDRPFTTVKLLTFLGVWLGTTIGILYFGTREEIHIDSEWIWAPEGGFGRPRARVALRDLAPDALQRRSLWDVINGFVILRSTSGTKLVLCRYYYSEADWARLESALSPSSDLVEGQPA